MGTFLGKGGGFPLPFVKPEPRHATVCALAELEALAAKEDFTFADFLRSRGYVSAETAHEENGIAEARRKAERKARR